MSNILGSETNPMNPNEASRFVEQTTAIGRTPFLSGPPGIGKTDCVHQMGARLGLPVITRLLSQFEPSDFIGLPHIYEDSKGRKRTKFAIPDSFEFDQPHILFLDEFAQADIAVQRAASEIILQHTLGGIPLATGIRVVAASNRKQDRAGVTEILGHNKSRLIMGNVGVNHGQWIDWALSHGVHDHVPSYVSAKPAALYQFDPKGQSYPCPRSWVAVSDAIKGHVGGLIEADMLAPIISGAIGSIEASAFMAFRETLEERPTMREILESPDKAKIPKKHPDQTAVALMVLANLEGIDANNNMMQAAEYLGRLSREAVLAAMKKTMNEATAAGDGTRTSLIGKMRGLVDN